MGRRCVYQMGAGRENVGTEGREKEWERNGGVS